MWKELLVDLYETLKSRNRHSYLQTFSYLGVHIDFRLINVPAETRSYLFRQQAIGTVFQESFVPKQTIVKVIECTFTRSPSNLTFLFHERTSKLIKHYRESRIDEATYPTNVTLL